MGAVPFRNMKKNVIIIFVILFLSVYIMSCEKDREAGATILSGMEQEIYELVNNHRDSIGLPTLVIDSFIVEEARNHSINMAKGITPFGHDGFNERAGRIFSELGGEEVGENVVEGNYPDAWSYVNSWLNSPSHKENIEKDYNYTGIGVAKADNNHNYCTQIFLKKQ
jgi:uncharacterized protein YkwD